ADDRSPPFLYSARLLSASSIPRDSLALRLEHAAAKRLAVAHELTTARPHVPRVEVVVEHDDVRVAADPDGPFPVREAQRARGVRGDEAERIGELHSLFADEIRDGPWQRLDLRPVRRAHAVALLGHRRVG